RILADERGFKARLAASLRKGDSIVDGRMVPDDQRPLVPEVVERMGAERFEGLATEGQLAPELQTAYRAELDAWYRDGADHTFTTLTHPAERHGVADAIPSEDPIRHRVLKIDEADLADYMERDLE